jgi:hypothetical protein
MISKIISDKVGLTIILFGGLLILAFNSNAASLTTYRIYLDDNNRTESFIVFSSGNAAEQCSLNFKYFNFDETGQMTLHRDASAPTNAAEDWVRYSPRDFVLQPGRPQTVRFSMRRKPNTASQEYRSYIAVSCTAIAEKGTATTDPQVLDDRASISVKPKLVQNVPLIVRTGPLDVQASFGDIVVTENIISAKILRSGKRSIFGRLSLINKETDEELAFTSSISIYPETSSHAFEFSTKNKEQVPVEQMLLRFTEDVHYGGSLTFEQSVK